MILSRKERLEFAEALRKALPAPVQERNFEQFGNYNAYNTFGYEDFYQPSFDKTRNSYTGIFFKCIDLRANAIAKAMQDVTVERRLRQNEWEQVEFSQGWVRLLDNPSTYLDKYLFWYFVSASIDAVGKADMYTIRDRIGTPIDLIPLFREFGELRAVPNADGSIKEWSFNRNDGAVSILKVEDVIRIHRPNPFNPYESISLLEMGMMEVETDNFMKVYRKNTVTQGGMRSSVLTTEQQLTPTQISDYGKEFKKNLGYNGLNTVAVLAGGLKPHSLGITPKDLEYIEGAKLTREQIYEITGVPKGLFENVSTKATGGTAEAVFAQYTVQPALDSYCSQMTKGFAKAFSVKDNSVRIYPPKVTPIDPDQELRDLESKISLGLKTRNEWRSEQGLSDLPDGDKALIKTSLTYAEQSQIDQTQANSGNRAVKKKE